MRHRALLAEHSSMSNTKTALHQSQVTMEHLNHRWSEPKINPLKWFDRSE